VSSRRIVNASPLILLAKIGRIDLLQMDGVDVVVPAAVLDEIAAHGEGDLVAEVVRGEDWLAIVPSPPVPDDIKARRLGAGESAVLSLALTEPDVEVVLDDMAARRCAGDLKIRCVGTLGLVLIAKELGAIPEARPVVEQLRRAGLYLTDELAHAALKLVGEAP
jgi:predicted nucleic acid-binding protein